MSLDDFKVLIDTFGADLAKWPPEQRSAAEVLLASSSEAQDVFRAASDFDGLLGMPDAPLSDERRDALVEAIMSRLDDDPDSP